MTGPAFAEQALPAGVPFPSPRRVRSSTFDPPLRLPVLPWPLERRLDRLGRAVSNTCESRPCHSPKLRAPQCLPCYTASLHVIHCKGALNFGEERPATFPVQGCRGPMEPSNDVS